MNDGIRFPVVWLIINCQSLEKFLFAFENGFQRGDGQGFSEASGAGEKIRFTGRIDQIPDEFRLVNIEITSLAEFLETVNTAGQILHSADSSNL